MIEANLTRVSAPAVSEHELIRQIGRGSYGEVWLARSVLGEFRAVKIVRQDGRHEDRPFQREFEGLQKFEPISRSHAGLVHILHAGRFAEGFFYVMELADDAKAPSSVGDDARSLISTTGTDRSLVTSSSTMEDYIPRTLRHDLHQPPVDYANPISGVDIHPDNRSFLTFSRQETVPAVDFLRLKKQLEERPNTDDWTTTMKWLVADPASRNISPQSTVAASNLVSRLLEMNSIDSLREALQIEPDHALATGLLARQVALQKDAQKYPSNLRESEFLSRRANQLV